MGKKLGPDGKKKVKRVRETHDYDYMKPCQSLPYDMTWPILKNDDMKAVLHELTSVLSKKLCNQLLLTKKKKLEKKYPKDEINRILKEIAMKNKRWKDLNIEEEIDSLENEDRIKSRADYFVLGINCVTKFIEKLGCLDLLIVCSSANPSIMTQHLLCQSLMYKIPACSIKNLSEAISPIFNAKSILAIGFKTVKDNPFTDTVDFIKNKIPVLDDLPEYHISRVIQFFKDKKFDDNETLTAQTVPRIKAKEIDSIEKNEEQNKNDKEEQKFADIKEQYKVEQKDEKVILQNNEKDILQDSKTNNEQDNDKDSLQNSEKENEKKNDGKDSLQNDDKDILQNSKKNNEKQNDGEDNLPNDEDNILKNNKKTDEENKEMDILPNNEKDNEQAEDMDTLQNDKKNNIQKNVSDSKQKIGKKRKINYQFPNIRMKAVRRKKFGKKW